MRYDPKQIEPKWQARWEKERTYHVDEVPGQKKSFLLIEFPYPSGEGLHVGHPRSYTAMDVLARKRRMEGENVLYPIGFDAFGLPTENYAIKTGQHPAVITEKNIANFRRQLKSLGYSFDWDREVTTSDPAYYKWTQWIFLKLFERGLAYKTTMAINWCPKDKIGLANEEVVGGNCERCGTLVEQREKEQWMLKITAYADRLLSDLRELDFLPRIKAQQENWIGKSDGAELTFPIVSDTRYRVVILHGYTADPEADFIPWLKQSLEAFGHEVVVPLLPHYQEGAVAEDDDVAAALAATTYDEKTILIGHSLGAVVAMKVLERITAPIAGTLLVGGFADVKFKDHERPFAATFRWEFDAATIRKNTGYLHLLHDQNDVAVSRGQADRLSALLGVPVTEVVAEDSHFTAAKEPTVLASVFPGLRVFTTRIDTIFGATYLVVAPEHPIIETLKPRLKNWSVVADYVAAAKQKTDIERKAEEKVKTGVCLVGVLAKNPATGESIPVYVADYVLAGYGTGAIMAVPAHDERDFVFAKTFGLPVVQVISSEGAEEPLPYIGDGVLVNSGAYNGQRVAEAQRAIAEALGATRTTQYKLRDWVFSRQRYWGEPIPMVYCERDGWVPLPEDQLPLELPAVEKYEPTDTGESPLAVLTDWVQTTCPRCGGEARRETDTMPNWAGSSWYYLRYCDPTNADAFAAPEKLSYWLPVDWYNGGMEHTTLHLLYSRFWHKFLFDIGVVPTPEPYAKRTSHGMILSSDGQKMSKSRGNVVNPDDVVKTFGADTLRTYELFMGPFADAIPWNTESIAGVRRFLERVWHIMLQPTDNSSRPATPDEERDLAHELATVVKKVGEDVDSFRLNTAVSAMMEFVNYLYRMRGVSMRKKTEALHTLLLILHPFAPHLTAELWEHVSPDTTPIWTQSWPVFDEADTVATVAVIAVQVNGKLRGTIESVPGASDDVLVEAAKREPNVARWLEGKTVVKTIVKGGKLVSFVVQDV